MNQSSVTFGFSTLKTKSDRLGNTALNQEQQKMADKFKALEPKRAKTGRSKEPSNKESRDALVFSDNSNIQLLLWKKGKMLGKNVFRDVTLTRSGNELFQLSQEIHKKSYDAPNEFAFETKEEYKQKIANKADKKKLLAWEAKEIAGFDFRITFRRAASTESDPSPDMAYYFKNRDDWVKTRNYLKFIKLLESEESKPEARPNLILQKLERNFQNVIKTQFRNLLKKRADVVKVETQKTREETIQNSEMLKNFDQGVVNTLKNSWSKYAEDSEAYKKEQERLAQERKESVNKAVQSSALLYNLNEELMKKLSYSWKDLVASKYSKDRRDIQVYFNNLELASDVIQPSLKVEIKFRKDYPDIPTINGKKITNKFQEYQLYCQFQYSRTNSVNCWRITPTQRVAESQSPMNLQTQQDSSPSPMRKSVLSVDDPFMLVFNDFRTEFIDCVEIKVILYDEISTIMGYYYASLKSLYTVAERGHSTCLCLKVNNETITKFPLIHLKILSYLPNRNKSMHREAVETTNKDYIEDMFYNYRFKIPAITPKHVKYLELLPDYWNIMEKKVKSKNKNKKDLQLIALVESVRSNLFDSYYQNTARQIAHGTRSAYLWSELQDELMLIASQPETLEENQLFVDCDSLRNIIFKNSTPEVLPTERPSKLDHAVSYLFKRDQWEKKSAWVGLYDKLKTFCRKGIPPQYRLSLWSELGKVVYFVELAESLLKKKRFLIDADEDREGVNFSVKARRVYEVLLRQSEERNSYLYQSLEEDIEYLRHLEGRDVLINERYLRKICKAFIAWSKLMSENSTPAKLRYYVPYSREIVVLCYGLVVCQTCRFIEGNTVVEEDQILWLLTSLSTYILSRYYQVNEDAAAVEFVNTKPTEGTENSSKSSSLTNSALRCNSIKGIKSDLLLLKLMLKETEKDIFYKFEEFGVPLEYYFADHMLTLFVNLFNPGLTFRCWDVIFFEGSGADGANANKMIICIIYALLKDCKEQILQARTPDDLKFIIELYARFETKYGNIIKKAYETFNTCLDVSLKPNASVLDRLSHFKQIMFTDISRGINKAMSQTERQLESFYQLVHQQNQSIYSILHPNQSLASDPENDLISYQALKKMISDFHSKFSSIQFKQGPKNKTIVVSLKIHQILLNAHGNGKIALEISCGGKTIAPEQSLTPLSTNFETKFEFPEAEGVPRDLLIEIYSQEEPTTSQRIGHRTVNLESLLQNTVNKTTLQMFSDNLATKKNIPDLSEIELSVFVSTCDPEEAQNNSSSSSSSQYLIVSELENPNFKNFRKLKLFNHQSTTLKTEEASPFLVTSPLTPKFSDKQLISTSSSPSYEIKQNFEISYHWFEKIVKGISPAWADKVDLESLYNLVSAADRGKKFYITNFFALLILFGKLTLNQRVELLFNVFTGYSGVFSEKVSDSVSSYIIKDLITSLYEAFMIYIPQNEVENLGDLIISGHTCFVTKVTLNGTHKIKPDFPRQTLNRLINYIHLHSGRKEVCLHSKEVVKILKTTYEKDMSINLLERASAGKQTNELKIYYTSNGLGNVFKLQITDNWEIVSEIQDEISDINPKSSESLSAFQNIISLTNQPKFVKKAEFVNIVKNIPMIDYLCSFDNLGMTEVLDTLKNPRFTVMIDREILYSVQPSFSPNIKLEPMSARSARASPEKFPKAKTANKNKPLSYYLENWDQVVERARFLKFAKKDEVGSQHRIEYDPQLVENQISFDKLNIYMPFADIAKLMKKRILKTASNLLDKSKDNIKHLNMKIFNRNLWKLDFKFILKIDTESFDVDLATKTPFHALNEILDQHRHLLHKDELAVEIQVSLQADKYILEKEPRPVQMALCTSPDGSREWLPCTVQFKYRFVDAIKLSTTPVRTDIDGYGIIYERFPKEIILKPINEVLFVNKINQENLEVREIEKEIVPGQ